MAPSAPVRDDAPLVLVVDDVAVNRRVAERALARLGYRTQSADSGLGALEMLAGTQCDAVLMDCRMPDMDGFAATAEIRRREGVRRTPIIAMTAHAQKSDSERCLSEGMDDYISKPIELAVLARVLSAWAPISARTPVLASSLAGASRAEGVLNPKALALIHAIDEPGQSSWLAELVDTFRAASEGYLSRLREAVLIADYAEQRLIVLEAAREQALVALSHEVARAA